MSGTHSLPGLSYHDLYVTTAEIPRTKLFNMSYAYVVECSRISGWELWFRDGADIRTWENRAGEFSARNKWLVLDVNGVVIIDSRRNEEEEDD